MKRTRSLPILTTLALAVALSVPQLAFAEEPAAEELVAQSAELPLSVDATAPAQVASMQNDAVDVVQVGGDSKGPESASPAGKSEVGDEEPGDVVSVSDNDAHEANTLSASASTAAISMQSASVKDSVASASVSATASTPATSASAVTPATQSGATMSTQAVASAVAKNADVMPAGTYVLVAGTSRGKVLDVSGASKKAGANVIIWTYNGGANQRWTLRYVNGFAVLYGIGGNVLEVAGSKAANGLNVRMGAYKGSANQRWTVMRNADNSVYFASALNEDYRLDITGASGKQGTNVELWSANSTSAQKWGEQSVSPTVPASAPVSEGWYSLRSAMNSSYYLDVTGCNSTNGTPLELWSKNTSTAQAFRIFKVGSYYRIETGAGAGSYLDVEAGKPVPGTKAEVWKSTTNCTLFSLQYEASLGGYRFVNVASGLALGVYSGKASQGAAVTAERSTAGSKAQTFVLVQRPGLLEEGIYRIDTRLAGNRTVSVKDGSFAEGASVNISSNLKAVNQKWQVKAVAGKVNTYTIENLSSGYRLAGANNAAATQRNASDSSVWWSPTYSNGGYCLKNVNTGKVLDVAGANGASGAQVMNWTQKSSGNVNQRFNMTMVPVLDSGIYEFLSSANAGYALDVHGASTVDGAKVELYQRKGSANQKWVYDASKDTITSLASGKLLDISGASAASGAEMIQWKDNGGKNQRWTVTYEGGGKFKVASNLGNSLVLSASETTNTAKVTSSTDTKAEKQRWRLAQSATVAPKGFNLISSIVSNGHGTLSASYIVIHETANPGATAKNHRDYWKGNDTYAVHYTVDWTGDCYYCVPEDRLCWQVGNGNKYVVGIELCHATSKSNFNKVWNYGVNWAAWQLAKNGWGVDRLISHYDCTKRWGGSDHTDPIGYFAEYGKTWNQFKSDVSKALANY